MSYISTEQAIRTLKAALEQRDAQIATLTAEIVQLRNAPTIAAEPSYFFTVDMGRRIGACSGGRARLREYLYRRPHYQGRFPITGEEIYRYEQDGFSGGHDDWGWVVRKLANTVYENMFDTDAFLQKHGVSNYHDSNTREYASNRARALIEISPLFKQARRRG